MSDFKEKLEDLGDDIKNKAEDLEADVKKAGAEVVDKAHDLGEKIKDSDIGQDIDREYNKAMGSIDLAVDDIRDDL